MSDYGYVAERARQAFASLARSERALDRNPQSASAQINYASRRKAADQAQAELLSLAEINRIEICDYRLMPRQSHGFALHRVASSYLNYQNLFSQIHDFFQNGRKTNAYISTQAAIESSLEIAYTYSGSLGVVLLAENDPSFFSGKLDRSVDALFDVVNTRDSSGVKHISHEFGAGVVKRLNDWSSGNVMGGFDLDINWKKSNGNHVGGVLEVEDFRKIVDLVSYTSEESSSPIDAFGMLVGINLKAGSFHISIPNGPDYRGSLGRYFSREASVEVGVTYMAKITETETLHFATGAVDKKFVLESLERNDSNFDLLKESYS